MRVAEGFGSGVAEGCEVCGVAFKGVLGFERAPGLGAYSAEGYAGEGDAVAFGAELDGGGGQGELVGGAVAELEVDAACAGARRWERDAGDEVAGLEDGFDVRRGAGDNVEVVDGDFAGARLALDVDGGFESGEGDVLVGGVGGDAVVTGAEDGEGAV